MKKNKFIPILFLLFFVSCSSVSHFRVNVEISRKAIVQTKKKADETFSRDRAIEERRFYTINLNFYFIDAQTGEVLYTQAFKETQGYKNPKQTGAFAFYDLADTVKGKLFNNVLGTARIQQRYLIKD